jgi:hypothetical protein
MYFTYFKNANSDPNGLFNQNDPSTFGVSNLSNVGNVRITGGLYDSNNIVGTAGSVLSSTGSGLSWIAAASVGTNYWNQTAAGIHTLSNVGVGTTNPQTKLHVVGTTLITGITTVGLGSTSTPPNNSQLSFELITDTNLRIKVRGSDGVLRSANITLS